MIELQHRRPDVERVDLRPSILAGLLLVVATLLGARLVLSPVIRSVDEALFLWVVPRLQESQLLVDVSQWMTEMGSRNLAYGAAVALAAHLLVVERAVRHAVLILVTLLAAHVLQWLAIVSVAGTAPTEFGIGIAGPFYSGGVVRAMITTGMLVHWVPPRRRRPPTRVVVISALIVGLIEGATRLVLGRHWPLDIVAGLPIGAGIVWCFVGTSRWLASTPSAERPRPGRRRPAPPAGGG